MWGQTVLLWHARGACALQFAAEQKADPSERSVMIILQQAVEETYYVAGKESEVMLSESSQL